MIIIFVVIFGGVLKIVYTYVVCAEGFLMKVSEQFRSSENNLKDLYCYSVMQNTM